MADKKINDKEAAMQKQALLKKELVLMNVCLNRSSEIFTISTQRKVPMSSRRKKDYFCEVVSEDVKIALKVKPTLSRKLTTELFVQCNQIDCQYVNQNAHPCPLHLELFAEEIANREEKRKARKEENSYY
jgi:hypothetical protein